MATQFVQQNVDGLPWKIDASGGTAAAKVYPLIDIPLVWNGVDAETVPARTICAPGAVDMTQTDYLVVATKGSPGSPTLLAYALLSTIAAVFSGTYQILLIVGKNGPRDWEQFA